LSLHTKFAAFVRLAEWLFLRATGKKNNNHMIIINFASYKTPVSESNSPSNPRRPVSNAHEAVNATATVAATTTTAETNTAAAIATSLIPMLILAGWQHAMVRVMGLAS
jgi:hypothetical protein